MEYLSISPLQLHALLTYTPAGFYCERGDFYIDPTRVVPKAVITHGHSDHARGGCKQYLCTPQCESILRQRLGRRISVQTVPYGEPISLNGVRVSLHPAGHILGSAQVRLEYQGNICVVSGDYTLIPDATCAPFEPIRCHTFITETTFGLPIYKWPPSQDVFRAINTWWSLNAEEHTTSVIHAYSLGKAQRVITGVDALIGPIITHETVENMNTCYRKSGVNLPKIHVAQNVAEKDMFERALVVTPSSANMPELAEKCAHISTAFASGWMQIRKGRKNSSFDRGFVLSDHADWEGLLQSIELSCAETIWTAHGSTPAFVRFLQEKGLDARFLN